MLYVPDFVEEFTFSFSWLLIFIGGPILPSFAFWMPSNLQTQKSMVCFCFDVIGVGAVWITANVQAGQRVAIFGLGAVGLAVSLIN